MKAMGWWKTITAKFGWVVGGLLLSLALLVAASGFTLSQMRSDARSAALLAKQRTRGYTAVYLVQRLEHEAGDARTATLAELQEVSGELERRHAAVKHGDPALGASPAREPAILEMNTQAEQVWYGRVKPALSAALSPSGGAGQAALLAQLRPVVDEYVRAIDDGMARVQAASEAKADRLLAVGLILGVILLGLVVLAGLLALDVSRRARGLAALAEQVAAGELDTIAKVRGDDELDAVAAAWNHMTQSLRSIIDAEKAGRAREAAQEARSRAILNTTPDAILTIDERGTVTSCNAAGERLFGYRADEVMGKNVNMLMPSPYREEHDGYVARYLRTGEKRIIGKAREVEAQRKDGSRFPMSLWVSELVHEGERMFIGVIQDISRRRDAEEKKQQLITTVVETAGRLASTAAEILAGTTQQAAGTQQQAAAVAQTVSTVDEVLQTSGQAAERAKAVADVSQRSVENTARGKKAVEETIDVMNAVKQQAESVADSILALAEQAHAIGEIIAVVNDIADQTNLLALNAAIEAARAGEHGRGFSVVAAEVRALADQSKKATSQVRQILGEIQKATNTAVLATEESSKGVNDAAASITRAGDAIRLLSDTIHAAAQSAAQIAASSGQQSAGMLQIQQAMKDIRDVTSHSLAATRQAEHAANDLHALARQLKELLAGIAV